MPRNRSTGQQPEALHSLEAAATAGSKKPTRQGLHASGKTAPKSAPLGAEQKAVAEILEAGADGRPEDMEKAAKKAPPR